MRGDQHDGDATYGMGSARPRLKTHEFGWDPSERLRLALRRAPAPKFASRKRLGVAAGAAAVALVALTGAAMLAPGRGDAQTATAEREHALEAREAALKGREDALAELERRRTASQDEIKESEKRIAGLENRRADLQRQIAELTAPVSPAGDETEQGSSTESSRAALAESDPSPPDEEASTGTVVSASSRQGEDDARPSTAQIARSAEPEVEPAPVAAAHNAGPVRVFIHVRSSDPAARERAEMVAAELRRRGVAVAQIRGVPRPVRRDLVRFFYDADREAVPGLQDAVRLASPPNGSALQSQDFRGYRAPPKPGTLELWLS
ncbi:hypothetical protein [Methylopila sp. M107]|uniref:hypothetical protein n=1 Tax=Methylopila sp. M107 TaxID=1101190 RepID=UPI00038132F7|nr:hypothetical protein [Methylopila sp. M107]